MSSVPAVPVKLRIDPVLSVLGITLLCVGLIAITSASVSYADARLNNPWYHMQRHLIYIGLATTAAAVAYRVPLQFLKETGWVWLFISLALLILVLLPGVGVNVNGSQRWLPLGPFTLQPSEVAKVALVIYLAGYLVRHEREVRSEWRGFVKPMIVLAAVTVLLLAEPDFGAAVICIGTAFGMLFLAGARLTYFLAVVTVALAGMLALVFAAPYRVRRLTAYTDPWADPFDSGFQLTQSLIAFGRGEWLGVGLGNSIQKLFYLPEAHTDFVFSVWAEETGLAGTLAVMALFAALIGRILWIARRAIAGGNPFGAYLCYGAALIFAGQAFVNMGVSSGLLPTKGLTLPFISYGGTSLIMCLCLLALVLRVERDLHAPRRAAR
ncbi:MAG: putative lipid II flippase FtsW [Pseudomonadota bacterium]